MDKWMSKILAEKGPPLVALQPASAELPAQPQPEPPAAPMPAPVPEPLTGRESTHSGPEQQKAVYKTRASTPGSIGASHEPPQAAPPSRQSLATSTRPELRHKSQSPLPCEGRRPAAPRSVPPGSGARPGAAATALAPTIPRGAAQPPAVSGSGTGAAGQGLDGMVTVMQLPKRAPPALAGRALQPQARNPSMGPISEATRHVADSGAARIGEATRHISVDQGIPLGESMRRQGASGASSPLGGSMMFNVAPAMAIPRAQTFGNQKPVPHSGAPSGAGGLSAGSGGAAVGSVQAQRSSSFSAYAGADGRPSGSSGTYSAAGPVPAAKSPYGGGARRGLSPVRSPAPVAPHRAQQPTPAQPAQAPPSQMTVQAVPPPITPQHKQGYPGEPRPGLEVSQRMQRANDLQHRFTGNKTQAAPPPAQLPLSVNLNTPSLLNWAKEQAYRGPPARLAPAHEMLPEEGMESPLGDGDPLGMGMGMATLHNLPPPPRSAPAAAEAAAAYGGGSGCEAGGGGGSLQFSLTVLTSDNRWESLSFFARDDLERQANAFLQSKGLKPAFRSGLVAKMQSMIAMRQTSSSVDIVDLI
uniref:Uncharacterized protein n=1 Tax=Alexandrium monilatum TaxID=311494 RepID=A0A7S4W055_9DINO